MKCKRRCNPPMMFTVFRILYPKQPNKKTFPPVGKRPSGNQFSRLDGERNSYGRRKYSSQRTAGAVFVRTQACKAQVIGHPDPMPNGKPAFIPSEQDNALIGAYWKMADVEVGYPVPLGIDHQPDVLNYLLREEDWWVEQGDEMVRVKGHPAYTQKASLLDSGTSGGAYLVPDVMDQTLITTPLLHSELLPYVTVRTLTKGSTVNVAKLGNPTITTGTAEGSAYTPFDCTSLISQTSITIYPVLCGLTVGRDLLADTPISNLGNVIMEILGSRYMEWLDHAIATGDGTTEPTGIVNGSGYSTVASANGTDGPFSVNDLENMLRGVGATYLKSTSNLRFLSNGDSYFRLRAIPVGSAYYIRRREWTI